MVSNLYSSWLVQATADFFSSETMPVTSLHDLAYLCFGTDIVVFYEAVKLLQKVAFLILANAYLDKESRLLLCDDKASKNCFGVTADQFSVLFKISINSLLVVTMIFFFKPSTLHNIPRITLLLTVGCISMMFFFSF